MFPVSRLPVSREPHIGECYEEFREQSRALFEVGRRTNCRGIRGNVGSNRCNLPERNYDYRYPRQIDFYQSFQPAIGWSVPVRF